MYEEKRTLEMSELLKEIDYEAIKLIGFDAEKGQYIQCIASRLTKKEKQYLKGRLGAIEIPFKNDIVRYYLPKNLELFFNFD